MDRFDLMSSTRINVIRYKKDIPERSRLKRVTLEKIGRIIVFLYRMGARNKTAIKSACQMNHQCCDLYLNWCIRENYIAYVFDDNGKKLYRLTDRGREFFYREFENSLLDQEYSKSALI